jgi:hypothetical protein
MGISPTFHGKSPPPVDGFTTRGYKSKVSQRPNRTGCIRPGAAGSGSSARKMVPRSLEWSAGKRKPQRRTDTLCT